MNQDTVVLSFHEAENVVVIPRKGFPSGKSKVLKRLLFVDNDFMDGREFMPCKTKNSFDDQSTAPLEMEPDSFDSQSPLDEVHHGHSPDQNKAMDKGAEMYSKDEFPENTDTESTYSSSTDTTSRRSRVVLPKQDLQKKKPMLKLNVPYNRFRTESGVWHDKSGSALGQLVQVLECMPSKKKKPQEQDGPERGRSLTPRRLNSHDDSEESLERDSNHRVDRKLFSEEEDDECTLQQNVIRLSKWLAKDYWSPKSSVTSSIQTPPTRTKLRVDIRRPSTVSPIRSWPPLRIPREIRSYSEQKLIKTQRVDLACLIAKALELQMKPCQQDERSGDTNIVQNTFKKFAKKKDRPTQRRPCFGRNGSYKRVSRSSQGSDTCLPKQRNVLQKKNSVKRRGRSTSMTSEEESC